MRYFLDTEFIERGPNYPLTLVSIGIVDEDGRQMYAVSSEFDPETANEWVKAHVFPSLGNGPRFTRQAIAAKICAFVSDDAPQFWGYYCDYDWVTFCQLFGTMVDLPKGWPMFCRDLKQWCVDLGNPELPKQDEAQEHNALQDAKWIRRSWGFLAAQESGRGL